MLFLFFNDALRHVFQSVHLCTVVCIEIILLCTEILMSNKNIFKVSLYCIIKLFKLYFDDMGSSVDCKTTMCLFSLAIYRDVCI